MSAVVIDLNDVAPIRAERPRFDVDLIVARLRDTAEFWVPRLFPNGRRLGDEWRLANIGGDAPRNSGSCVITLRGAHAGDWIDFDGNHGGGPISAIEAAIGLTGYELIAEAAGIAGVTPGAPPRQVPAFQPAPRRDPAQEVAHILAQAAPAPGTPAERYLAGRGLVLREDADLLFHPDLTHWESKSGYPALIGVVRDRVGEIIGLHRTYLEEAGGVTKAAVAKPRMMLGRVAGGAVRLGAVVEGAALGICEGIETGLAVMTARPDLPVWATLSTSGLEQVALPASATRIVILADHDASGAGLRAAETAARRLRSEGREVVIAMPSREGVDFNDLLLREGPEAVEQTIAAAETPPEDAAPVLIGQHRPLNYAAPRTGLPIMRADEGDLGRAVEKAWSLLLGSNRTPWLYRYAGIPTWVVPDDEGRPVAATLTEERLRHMLARLGDWRRMNAKGELVPAPPPTAVVKSVLATPDPGLPVLVGIVNTPVFGRSGTLLTAPGYHPDARLLYVPAPGFDVPPVPARPTAADVAAARTLICDELLGDFPFVAPAERAHAVAMLLLGFLRGMIDGPTPLHLIEKPTPGTGATLMVDAIATILTGAGASVMTEGRDDDEWRKRVTAKLRQVPTILLIDNLRLKLDSSAVAAALTAPFWEDRILGQSEMARLPIRCLWIATGNNPEFSNEMARRLVRIRLDANVERPWQRSDFRHPDLMTWVRANRARLVHACLTLCQAWIAEGRPRGTRTIGSYENWAHVLGGVLEVTGIDGFLGNLDEMMAASDSEGAAWSGLVRAWWNRFGTAVIGSGDLYPIACACETSIPIGGATEHARRIAFGRAIGGMRDRIFDLGSVRVRIQKAGVAHNSGQWQLVVSPDGSAPRSAGASTGGCRPEKGDVGEGHPPSQPVENEGSGGCGGCGGYDSNPTHMRTRAHAIGRREEHPPHPPHPQMDVTSTACGGGYAGGCVSCQPPTSRDLRGRPADVPDWLREVLE
ncbi:MAG: toprim domain-containing protein [Rhodobacteraceae bacterium]|nr:toprim domain-containing protein [Paracoccaceae bacterium]